ncbi:MAG TPA: RecX family transcriptional regulator [Acidobacteriota bacterium]|nr:RecX family transcriptional regulator [Acidobacteriota bacterium]
MSPSKPDKPEFERSRSKKSSSPKGKSAYMRAVGLLAKRAHSSSELRRKLKSRHSDAEIEEALKKLEGQGFVDDAQFAAQRACLCRLDKAWGDRRIELDLQQRHQIKERDLAQALEAAEAEQPEQQALERIVQNWLRLRGEPSTVRDLKKLHDRCLRLGHRPDRVRSRLDAFFRHLDWDAD